MPRGRIPTVLRQERLKFKWLSANLALELLLVDTARRLVLHLDFRGRLLWLFELEDLLYVF